MNWEQLHWPTIDRLRQTFLAEKPSGASYWSSRADLEHYELTFAQRIAWKWDAVLRELKLRRWSPPSRRVLDWACGSGIAGRRVIEFFGPERFDELRVHDRSPLAVDFAAAAARLAFPDLRVEPVDASSGPVGSPVGLLIISHVLNELTETGGQALRAVIDRADAVLWVEPGTYADSRSLIALREALRGQFRVVAPCTHQAACGLQAPENQRHWCHHFARMPPAIMADPDWVRFAQRAGIDLRSLPYSFLVLERRDVQAEPSAPLHPPPDAGWSRILGVPRSYKAYARVLGCQENGVRELTLQKRDAPEVFKRFRQDSESSLCQWRLDRDRIVEVTPLTP